MKERERERIRAHAKEMDLTVLKDEVRMLTDLAGAEDPSKGAKVVWSEQLAIYTMEVGRRVVEEN